MRTSLTRWIEVRVSRMEWAKSRCLLAACGSKTTRSGRTTEAILVRSATRRNEATSCWPAVWMALRCGFVQFFSVVETFVKKVTRPTFYIVYHARWSPVHETDRHSSAIVLNSKTVLILAEPYCCSPLWTVFGLRDSMGSTMINE
jgi:hypothetical protein